jgi:hypothetical protein
MIERAGPDIHIPNAIFEAASSMSEDIGKPIDFPSTFTFIEEPSCRKSRPSAAWILVGSNRSKC